MKTLVLLLLPCACGSPLVADDYRGTVRFTLKGIPNQGTALSTVEADKNWLRASLFWAPGARSMLSYDELVEQPSTSVLLDLPWSFEWNVYDLPEDRHTFTTASGAKAALGVPTVYADRNGNGRRDGDEPVVGRGAINLALWAPDGLSKQDSPTSVEVPAGFHMVNAPLFCRPPPPAPTQGPTDCGVPLGAACTGDGDCNGGKCLTDHAFPFPGGACVVTEPPPDGCRPANAALWRPGRMLAPYWLKACRSDADCGRDFPYQCDFAFGACMPTLHVLLLLESNPTPPPVCRPMGP